MRILIIHNEAQYFAGAEKVLGYYLEGLLATNHEVAAAVVPDARVLEVIPSAVRRIWIPEKQQFSIAKLWRQAATLRRARHEFPFDLIHGWTARDWELTSLVGWLSRRPSVGTLHDHPRARFISPVRRRLMRWCGRWGLRKVICVSQAVRSACLSAGYPQDKLEVVHNGLPDYQTARDAIPDSVFRLGFLGAFSERKGLPDLFSMLAEIARTGSASWEMRIAGEAQDALGKGLVAQIRKQYAHLPWWHQVHWLGWVDGPTDFLRSLDLLVVPSTEFDPFPTVLLEAGRVGIPVLAARVGGVPEIVVDGQTGWLYEAGDWRQAAGLVGRLIAEPEQLGKAGELARERIRKEFTLAKMVANYLTLYSALLARE